LKKKKCRVEHAISAERNVPLIRSIPEIVFLSFSLCVATPLREKRLAVTLSPPKGAFKVELYASVILHLQPEGLIKG